MTNFHRTSLWKALVGTAALTFSLSAMAANESPRDLCSKIDFNGTFRTQEQQKSPAAYEPIRMRQNGCIVTVTDPNPPTKVYTFDLSGETEFHLPQAVLDINNGSDFAYQSLQSMRGTTTLVRDEKRNGAIIVKVSMSMDFPKDSLNTLANTLSITGDLYPSGGMSLAPGGASTMGPFLVDGLTPVNVKYRVTKIDNPLLVGPLQSAFVDGINYVLHFFDTIDITQTIDAGIFSIRSATN